MGHSLSILFVMLSGPGALLALHDDNELFISRSVMLFVESV